MTTSQQQKNDKRRSLGKSDAPLVTERVYETLRAVNFSSGVCEPLAPWLRVLPVPEVGWSDWGNVERICTALQQLGKMNDAVQRALSAVRASQKGEECPHPFGEREMRRARGIHQLSNI